MQQIVYTSETSCLLHHQATLAASDHAPSTTLGATGGSQPKKTNGSNFTGQDRIEKLTGALIPMEHLLSFQEPLICRCHEIQAFLYRL